MAVYGGHVAVVTDINGQPNTFNQFTGWNSFAPNSSYFPCVQMAPTMSGFLCLSWDHQWIDWNSTYWTGKGPPPTETWVNVGGSASEIFGSASGDLIAATSLEDRSVLAYFLTGFIPNWYWQGGPGNAFAVSNEMLWGLSSDRTTISQSTNVFATGPSWTPIGGGVGRIVGGGTQGAPLLYAASCAANNYGTCASY
jgi:hypothetical protein